MKLEGGGTLWALRGAEGEGSILCLCVSSGFLPPEAFLAPVSHEGQLQYLVHN